MTPRIHTMAPHTRRMSEARRNHIHGPLQPMDDKLPGDGEWQWMLPWITLASGFVMALIVWSIA